MLRHFRGDSTQTLKATLNYYIDSYYRTLRGNPMREVKPTGQGGHMVYAHLTVWCMITKSGHNSKQAITGAISEAFTRWLSG